MSDRHVSEDFDRCFAAIDRMPRGGNARQRGQDAAAPTATVHGVEPPRMAFAPGVVEAWSPDQFYRSQDLPPAWRVQPGVEQARDAARSLGRPMEELLAYTVLSLPDLGFCWSYHEAGMRLTAAERQGGPTELSRVPILMENTQTWRQSYGDDKFRELLEYFADGAHGKPPGNWAVVWGGRP